jgi:hypothetical protein
MNWLKKLFKKEHVHDWHFDYNSKNATAYYCNNCPQLAIKMHDEAEHRLLTPIITEFDNKGNYNGLRKRIR